MTQVEAMKVETNWSMAGPIPGDPDWAGGKVFRDAREMVIDAPDSSVYGAVCRIGGKRGWSMSWLWRIRGWVDRLAGGPGLRRPARSQSASLWRCVGFLEGRGHSKQSSCVVAGGDAIARGGGFGLPDRTPPGGEKQLYQTALFRPRGLFGLLYWWAVFPFHHFVFRKMLEDIALDALDIARRAVQASAVPPLPT